MESFETGHRHGGWCIYFQHCDLFQLQSFTLWMIEMDIDTVIENIYFNTGSVPVSIIHIMDHLKLDTDTVVDL